MALIAIVNKITFYLMTICFALFYLFAFALGFLGKGQLFQYFTVMVMGAIVGLPIYFRETASESSRKSNSKYMSKLIVVWFMISYALVHVTKGACTCVFNEFYGIQVKKIVSVST